MSGGFYKYHCKYWMSYNCDNWVYVNGSPCARCCAEGRDDEQPSFVVDSWRFSRDIFVPRMEDGTIYYTLMEIVNQGETTSARVLRRKVHQQVTGHDAGPEVTKTMPEAPKSPTAF